uniref:Uncharacterized protein n=1 Tax=Ananas comosus var. bracteatus TaxID=296719 RepID=A0A6V7NM45_ANACO|nr:unnamed protein product [Ananas comosus var. bracteatus]
MGLVLLGQARFVERDDELNVAPGLRSLLRSMVLEAQHNSHPHDVAHGAAGQCVGQGEPRRSPVCSPESRTSSFSPAVAFRLADGARPNRPANSIKLVVVIIICRSVILD